MGARFIRLGIAGFKSFAEATTLEILPGLTGIVGPNGCGKSNVAEALRWVMGEANARHLRGGEMDDIIFSGTASRSSRNLAEVSLTVEDDDQGLPPPFSGQAELQVVRRLERGAGSVYRVNGREARARDVQTLFADLASGARSSAMVSQGRVGMLVNARPEERRAVLEEAAGITGLHARRAEAETRLRATETNLERAEERRVLLDRQQEGLRDQARQAARYRTVVEAMLDTEAALLSVQRERASVARDAALGAVATAEAEMQQATVASATAAAEAERRHADLPGLRVAEHIALAGAERARMALDAIEAELGRARSALAAAQQRHGQLIRDHAHAEATLNDAETADARLVTEAAQLAIEAGGHPALMAAANTEATDASAALLEADQAAGETAAHAAAAGARMAAAQQLLQQAEARLRRAEGAVARLAADRAAAARQLVDADRMQQAAGALQAAIQALDAAKAEQEAADRNQVEAAKTAKAAREVFNRRDTERHRLAAETQALAEILSVNDGEHWPPMVDSLVVAAGLEAALGTALGDDLAAAADPDAARHWRTLPALPASRIPGRPLAESVAGPPSLSRALAGIGLVDTEMEGDAAQAALLPGQCVVSAGGALWRWDGYTVRAGTPTTATIRLQQRNRLNRLKQALAETIATASTARAERDLADRAETDAVAAAVQRRRQQRDAEQAADRARASVQQLRNQAEAAESRLAAIDAQLAELSPEAALARAAFESAHQAHSDQPDTALLKRRAEEAKAAVACARQRDLAASRNVDRLQRSDHQRQARLSVIEREREDRRMRAADLDGRVTDLRARAKEAAMELDHLAAAPAHIEAGNEAAGIRVAEAEAAGKAARSAREQAEAAAAQATAAARTAEQAGYAAREAIVRAESLQGSAMQAWDTALARIAEREGCLPPLQAPAEVSVAAEDRARNRLQRLTRERDEIGPVNLRAETEIAAIKGEIATIVHECSELGTAVAKLRGSIGHLNREGRERLTEVFQQVDRHFQSLFSRMFGGGRAHLALIGSDDPLQAGLEIYAQPPGKKLSALSLLSGGEQALTALSLIFAVFRCNPAPLCILDEVDAPLDDANVGRFCTLLTDMVQETGTRFLVVTHHQVTMASMDRLYGVTMQERGVSRLLSVDLSHAVGMIEAVAAE